MDTKEINYRKKNLACARRTALLHNTISHSKSRNITQPWQTLMTAMYIVKHSKTSLKCLKLKNNLQDQLCYPKW